MACDLAVYRPSNSTFYVQTPTYFTYRQFGRKGMSRFQRITTATALRTRFPAIGGSVVHPDGEGFHHARFRAERRYPGAWRLRRRREGRRIALFRPSTAQWFVLGTTGKYFSRQFGEPGDKPLPFDYDSDGKTDFAVVQASGRSR